MSSNDQRAEWAQSCLEHLGHLSEVDHIPDLVADLIANLGHYCQANGFDFICRLKTGIGHWHVEQVDPEALDILPVITITINESTTYACH